MSATACPGDPSHLARLRVAASAILKATHLLVAAGAGFSADSGLPCYDAIASVQAYQEQDITYADLCTPSLLESNSCMVRVYLFVGKMTSMRFDISVRKLRLAYG